MSVAVDDAGGHLEVVGAGAVDLLGIAVLFRRADISEQGLRIEHREEPSTTSSLRSSALALKTRETGRGVPFSRAMSGPLRVLPREISFAAPDPEVLGHKGARLVEVAVLKARVPRFGVVTAQAFDAHIAQPRSRGCSSRPTRRTSTTKSVASRAEKRCVARSSPRPFLRRCKRPSEISEAALAMTSASRCARALWRHEPGLKLERGWTAGLFVRGEDLEDEVRAIFLRRFVPKRWRLDMSVASRFSTERTL